MCFHEQLGKEEGSKDGLGICIERLHMVEKAGMLSITESRQKQELHVLRSLCFSKGIDDGSL